MVANLAICDNEQEPVNMQYNWELQASHCHIHRSTCASKKLPLRSWTGCVLSTENWSTPGNRRPNGNRTCQGIGKISRLWHWTGGNRTHQITDAIIQLWVPWLVPIARKFKGMHCSDAETECRKPVQVNHGSLFISQSKFTHRERDRDCLQLR